LKTTPAILAELPILLGGPRRDGVAVLCRRPGRRGRLGAPPRTWGAMWLEQVDEVSAGVVQTLTAPEAAMRAYAGDVLLDLADAWRAMMVLRSESMSVGATGLGDASLELARRIRRAMEQLGEGAGASLRAYLGFSPAQGLSVLALVGLAVLGAGVFVVATPGAQALLAGGGSGIASYGAGAGKALPVLAREIPRAVSPFVR